MAFVCCMFLSVWMQLVLNSIRAETSCRNELISSTNISTDLQSEVLLPCVFNSSLLGSDLTADIAAVWIYKNITEDSLLEIRLNSGVGFWNTRGGRINPFPKLSTSGNFSILLQNVNESDLGLYRCELHNGINCSIAYQEIRLISRESPKADGLSTVLITAAAAAGGIVLLSLLIITWFCSKRNINTREETVCSTLHHSDTVHTACQYTLDNPIYDTFIPSETNSCAKEEEGISPNAAVYAIVKKKKKSTKTERNQS